MVAEAAATVAVDVLGTAVVADDVPARTARILWDAARDAPILNSFLNVPPDLAPAIKDERSKTNYFASSKIIGMPLPPPAPVAPCWASSSALKLVF